MTSHRLDPDESAKLFHALSGGESRRIVRDLLAVRRARAGKAGLRPEGSRPAAAGREAFVADYSPAFRGLSCRLRDHAAEMARQRQRLPALRERLRELTSGDRRIVLRADPAFHNWALGEELIEESRKSLGSDLDRARELADCAAIVIGALEPGRGFGGALINDLKARAWGARGEVLRRLADLRGAGEAFAAAEGFIAQGTGDPLEEAGLLELRSALCRDQSRIREAHHLLDDAAAVYRRYRDFHLMGRAYVRKGCVHGQAGELAAAVDWLRKGLSLIDPERDRLLDLAARHRLMLYLTESGRAREARFLLKASRAEMLRHGTPWLLARLRWLEGKIYCTLCFPAEAERALIDARQGFLDLKAELNAAAVSLDLAVLYTAQGRAAEVRRLAAEILPIFRSRNLGREAIAALIALRQASRMETRSARLLAEVRARLDRAHRDPTLRFEPL
jgi:tetratricopeptide (TPR) repeat protein